MSGSSSLAAGSRRGRQAAHGDARAPGGGPRRRRPAAPPTASGRTRRPPPRRPRRRWRRRRCGRPALCGRGRQQVVLDGLEQAGHARGHRARRGTAAFVPTSRRTTVTTPSARSRGPTSMRTGTPFSSQSTDAPAEADVDPASSSTRTPGGVELGGQPRGRRRRRRPSALHEHHDDLRRGQPGRQPQAGVVAVAMIRPPDHAGRHAPRRLQHELLAARSASRYWMLEGPGEVLARARGWCPSAGPCRRASSPRRSWC